MKCEIIRDLLPLYIDNLTSEVSNEAIRSHLEECAECKKYYSEMNGEIETEETVEINAEEQKDIDVLKTFRRMRRIGISVACGVVVVILLSVYLIGYHYISMPYDPQKMWISVETETGKEVEYPDGGTMWGAGIHTSYLSRTNTFHTYRTKQVILNGREEWVVFTSYQQTLWDRIRWTTDEEQWDCIKYGGAEVGGLRGGAPIEMLSKVYYLDKGIEKIENADNDEIVKIIEKYGHLVWENENL